MQILLYNIIAIYVITVSLCIVTYYTQIYVILFLSFGAYAAYEQGFPVDTEVEHRERSLLMEYKLKSDPMTIKDGWLGEKMG